ncbi:MAG: outer membrane lipoprotein-sorting protein [Phycisphaerae bacterium]|nr:outer membrane lipoprotein-sorting protein [Phycisphaerae bacterium]
MGTTKAWFAAASVVIALVAAGAARAAEAPSVEEIVKRTNYTSYYQGKDGRARVKMTITDAQDRERHREFTILRRDDQPEDGEDPDFTGEQKFYVYFHKPADVAKMTYLVWKHIGKDDDRWLYLPGVDLVKRIAATDKRSSFVGSNFYYEDISGRQPALDNHELIETNKNFYVLKSKPKDPEAVEFSYYKTWVHTTTALVIQQEYYDKNGQAYRKYESKKVEQVDGYWTTVASRMTDLQTGRYTDLTYPKVEYNVGIDEDIFTERYLRRPPTQYIDE